MHNEERKMIKWLPFNSVMPLKKSVYEVEKEKQKIEKPVLSEDEQKEIEKIILESYYEKKEVTVYYFYKGYITKIKSQIKKIDSISKKIYLDNKILIFSQIVKIN